MLHQLWDDVSKEKKTKWQLDFDARELISVKSLVLDTSVTNFHPEHFLQLDELESLELEVGFETKLSTDHFQFLRNLNHLKKLKLNNVIPRQLKWPLHFLPDDLLLDTLEISSSVQNEVFSLLNLLE